MCGKVIYRSHQQATRAVLAKLKDDAPPLRVYPCYEAHKHNIWHITSKR